MVAAAISLASAAQATEQMRAAQTLDEPTTRPHHDIVSARTEQAREESIERLRLWHAERGAEPVDKDGEEWRQFVDAAKSDYDAAAWNWFEGKADATDVVATLREELPDFPAYHLEWARIAMQLDADTVSTPSPGGWHLRWIRASLS